MPNNGSAGRDTEDRFQAAIGLDLHDVAKMYSTRRLIRTVLLLDSVELAIEVIEAPRSLVQSCRIRLSMW